MHASNREICKNATPPIHDDGSRLTFPVYVFGHNIVPHRVIRSSNQFWVPVKEFPKVCNNWGRCVVAFRCQSVLKMFCKSCLSWNHRKWMKRTWSTAYINVASKYNIYLQQLSSVVEVVIQLSGWASTLSVGGCRFNPLFYHTRHKNVSALTDSEKWGRNGLFHTLVAIHFM